MAKHLTPIALLTGFVLIVLVLIISLTHRSQPTITINQHTFKVTIANTLSQQQKGLGGTTHLNPDQGMYFPLDPSQPSPDFWMKDMLIPIDIIWIKDHRIVGINVNVPAYPLSTPDDQLPRYHSPVIHPDAVLEIAANRSTELAIKVGDEVQGSDIPSLSKNTKF